MAVELKRGGLHLTGTALWLDARRKSELSFVSHAHSDHIARHEAASAEERQNGFLAMCELALETILAVDG